MFDSPPPKLGFIQVIKCNINKIYLEHRRTPITVPPLLPFPTTLFSLCPLITLARGTHAWDAVQLVFRGKKKRAIFFVARPTTPPPPPPRANLHIYSALSIPTVNTLDHTYPVPCKPPRTTHTTIHMQPYSVFHFRFVSHVRAACLCVLTQKITVMSRHKKNRWLAPIPHTKAVVGANKIQNTSTFPALLLLNHRLVSTRLHCAPSGLYWNSYLRADSKIEPKPHAHQTTKVTSAQEISPSATSGS